MQSDMTIPRLSAIVDRALDYRASAVRIGDDAAIEHIDTLIKRLPLARFSWQLGVLIVRSPSGQTYHVWNGGCDCINGRFHKDECWHWLLYNTLLDLFQTECETADIAACDPPGENPLGDDEGDALPSRTPWYARATVVRQCYYAVNWNS